MKAYGENLGSRLGWSTMAVNSYGAGRFFGRAKIRQQRDVERGFAGAVGPLLPVPHLMCAAVWLLLVKIMKVIPGMTIWLLPWELL